MKVVRPTSYGISILLGGIAGGLFYERHVERERLQRELEFLKLRGGLFESNEKVAFLDSKEKQKEEPLATESIEKAVEAKEQQPKSEIDVIVLPPEDYLLLVKLATPTPVIVSLAETIMQREPKDIQLLKLMWDERQQQKREAIENEKQQLKTQKEEFALWREEQIKEIQKEKERLIALNKPQRRRRWWLLWLF